MRRFLRVLQRIGIGLIALILILAVVYTLLPKGPRDPMQYTDRTGQPRELFVGKEYAAVTGTPWATDAALSILEQGGTACDAAVAALLALNVTHGEAASFASVAPTMYYNAATGEVKSYIGVGKAPAAATIEKFSQRGFKTVPEFDIWAQLVPASPDVLTALLSDCGTMSFSQVSAPAIAVAREGFPAHKIFVKNFDLSPLEEVALSLILPENARVYFHGEWWRPMNLHERIQLPDLANTFEELAKAEQDALAAGGDRKQGLQAVRSYFYKGPIAQKIVQMHQQQNGLITAEDLASYSGGWEQPIKADVAGGYTFYGNGTWSQGIMEPLVLHILEGIDLKKMGHNSPEYIHTVTQAIELAMADRDGYVADPAFTKVPLEALLSPAYAAQRRALMTDRAFGILPKPGDIPGFTASVSAPEDGRLAGLDPVRAAMTANNAKVGKDTTQLVVRDRQGNTVVMTPSDFPKTPMVPNTGINLGNRMNQFRLDPAHVNALEPGKRPRITPHAVIVFKDGAFSMGYSTPGGDTQSQALVQVFLNMSVFGMDIQQAISAPRFYSTTAPSSFAPHNFTPGGLRIEGDLYDQVGEQMKALGYDATRSEKWDNDFGAVGGVVLGQDGQIYAGADPREETTAGGK